MSYGEFYLYRWLGKELSQLPSNSNSQLVYSEIGMKDMYAAGWKHQALTIKGMENCMALVLKNSLPWSIITGHICYRSGYKSIPWISRALEGQNREVFIRTFSIFLGKYRNTLWVRLYAYIYIYMYVFKKQWETQTCKKNHIWHYCFIHSALRHYLALLKVKISLLQFW